MKEAAQRYKKLRDDKDYLESEVKRIKAELETLEAALIEEMLQEGITSMRIEGVGMLTVNNKLAAKIVDKEKFFEWLRQTDRESLIKRDVNYMTLQAFANELEQNELAAAHDAGMDYEDKVVLSLKK